MLSDVPHPCQIGERLVEAIDRSRDFGLDHGNVRCQPGSRSKATEGDDEELKIGPRRKINSSSSGSGVLTRRRCKATVKQASLQRLKAPSNIASGDGAINLNYS